MPSRRSKPRDACQRLRTAVDSMPRAAREAMLRGIEENTIIVGAYVDPGSGGICPMLAAHRNGGRTDLASFARSWDRYTDARRPRLASDREVGTLRSLLEVSLVSDDGPESLSAAARRIRAERAALGSPPPQPGADDLPKPRHAAEEPRRSRWLRIPSGLPIRIHRTRKQADAERSTEPVGTLS